LSQNSKKPPPLENNMKKRLIIFAQLLPVILSLLVVGAHFLRSGWFPLTFLCLVLICSLIVREPFIPRIIQFALFLSSMEWLRSTFVLTSDRINAGQSWTKLAVILGCVAFVAFCSIFVFFTQSLKELYHLDENEDVKVAESKSAIGMAGLIKEDDQQGMVQPVSEEYKKIHTGKIALNALSPVSFLLMDFSMGVGFVALIIIGFVNSSLRRKMNAMGGFLTAVERKGSFLKQTVGMAGGALAVILYYLFSLPASTMRTVIIVVVMGYITLMSVFSYFEYLHKGRSH